MSKPVPKRKSGPTISDQERRARGYGRVTLSLPDATNDLIDQLAAQLGCTRSAVVVQAIGALLRVPLKR